jgi:hypothetical protein
MQREMPDRRLKVVYIAGWGGSGTTIIDNVLGQVDGWHSTGELHALWPGLRDGQYRCGCGTWIGNCTFWSSVVDRGFGKAGRIEPDLDAIVGWQNRTARMRRFASVLHSLRGATPRWHTASYAAISHRLYSSIADVSGARVIVDSSKVPSYAALLRLMPEIEPYIVHLVRDPRAVAYSWRRRGSRNAFNSALHWMLWNLAVDRIRRSLDPTRSIVVRYEDFATCPVKVIGDILRMAGEADDVVLPFVDEHTARLAPNHTVSGNKSRFRIGDVRVELDRAWEEESPAISRATSTLVALPLLKSFGYRICG